MVPGKLATRNSRRCLASHSRSAACDAGKSFQTSNAAPARAPAFRGPAPARAGRSSSRRLAASLRCPHRRRVILQGDRKVHDKRRGDADRNAVAMEHAVQERELIFQPALLERRVPPAPFERRGKACIPQPRVDLRLGLDEANREARRAHAWAASRATPTMISTMPIHRVPVTRSFRKRWERIATTTKAMLPIGKAVLTSTNCRAPV